MYIGDGSGLHMYSENYSEVLLSLKMVKMTATAAISMMLKFIEYLWR